MNKKILQLRIEIKGIKPPIWRRILVEDNITFLDLHKIIQIAFDWEEYHLYHFSPVGNNNIRIISTENEFYEPLLDPFELLGNFFPMIKRKNKILESITPKDFEESKTKLNKFLKKEKDKMVYFYDYGDGWEHLIKVEKILEFDKKAKYPICIKGKRAAPLKDIGGVTGYYNFIDALQNEDHEIHKEYIKMGYEFDTEKFDLDEINEYLKDYKEFGIYEKDSEYEDYVPDNIDHSEKIIDFSEVQKLHKNKKK